MTNQIGATPSEQICHFFIIYIDVVDIVIFFIFFVMIVIVIFW